MVDLRLVLTPDVFCANTALMHTAFLSPLVAKLTKYLKILLTVLTTVYISSIANFVRNRRPPQAHHLPSFPIKTKNPLGSILTKMVTNGRTWRFWLLITTQIGQIRREKKPKKSFLCISYSDKFKNLKLQVLKGNYKVFHKIILLCRNSNILINSFICFNL